MIQPGFYRRCALLLLGLLIFAAATHAADAPPGGTAYQAALELADEQAQAISGTAGQAPELLDAEPCFDLDGNLALYAFEFRAAVPPEAQSITVLVSPASPSAHAPLIRDSFMGLPWHKDPQRLDRAVNTVRAELGLEVSVPQYILWLGPGAIFAQYAELDPRTALPIIASLADGQLTTLAELQARYGIRMLPTLVMASDETTETTPTARVLFPNANMAWQRGSLHAIRWSGFTGTSVTLVLWRNGAPLRQIAEAIGNTGEYEWLVPGDLPSGPGFLVEVQGEGGQSDLTEVPFKIRRAEASVTRPARGATLLKQILFTHGFPYTIRWQGLPGERVRIELYRSGAFVRRITSSTPNDGAYRWLVQYDLVQGGEYQIKVKNTLGDFGMSARSFNIQLDRSHVDFTPATVSRDLTYPLYWRGFLDDELTVELHRNGTYLRTIAASVANASPFEWRVPTDLASGPGYALVVRGRNGQSRTHGSRFTLTIRPPQVLSPNFGSDLWLNDFVTTGSAVRAYWVDYYGARVRIDLHLNGTFVRTIEESTPNDGQFDWVVPGGLEPVWGYSFVITGEDGQSDASDFPFGVLETVDVDYRIELNWTGNSNAFATLVVPSVRHNLPHQYSIYGIYENIKFDYYPFATLNRTGELDGPEVIQVARLMKGSYNFWVRTLHNDPPVATIRGLTAKLYRDGTLLQTWTPPAGAGNIWHVFDLDGATQNVVSVNRIIDGFPF